MTPAFGRSRRAGAILTALTLVLTVPASALSVHGGFHTAAPAYLSLVGPYAPAGATPGTLYPLIASGEGLADFGLVFEGIPDGIGLAPGTGGAGTIDIYVTHEQSHVPFPIGGPVDPAPPTLPPRADFQDSTVTRVTVDTATRTVVGMAEVLPASAGFIRFCSAFMAGPLQGFSNHTFLVNEESDDNLPVPAGALYPSDPSIAPLREAGYSVWLDTATGEFAPITRLGRHNHENTVVVPGGWNELAVLSGDDTFLAPSSQLYLFTTKDAASLMRDKGQLWAFQVTAEVTAEGSVPVDPYDAFNGANDYGDLTVGETFSGRFIHVPTDIARGVTTAEPQAGLEAWSNANNVFQFIRVEDIAYDPLDPRVIYFADTGERRARPDADFAPAAQTGRLHRDNSFNGPYALGRIFRMVLNENDPRIVDSLTVVADASDIGMRNPDNLDVGQNSLMVQEDVVGSAKVWRYDLRSASPVWTHVATVIDPPPPPGGPWVPSTVQGESSGIVDASAWMDAPGWWALDVQSHREQFVDMANILYWPDGPDAGTDPDPYRERREHGQLLLMYLPGT